MRATAFLVAAILLVALDQWSKASVVWWLPNGRTAFFGIVTIRAVLNQRVRTIPNPAMLALWLGEVLFLLVMVQSGLFFRGEVAAVALGAAVGGAASNVVDCLWRDGVIDFIDVGFWPVFNLADVAIVAGVLIAIVDI